MATIKKPNIHLVKKNLLSQSSLNDLNKNFDYIFHFAAKIGVQHVLNSPYDVLSQNIQMLKNVITFGKKQENLKKLVFASTSEVYAGSLENGTLKFPTPEDSLLSLPKLTHPRTSYMLSKIYGEVMCLHSNLPIMIVRPHNFYGPRMGMSHVIPELISRSSNSDEHELEVYSPGHLRTFCFIEDAVSIISKLTFNKKTVGGTYNVGNNSEEITMYDLAKKIIKINKSKQLIKKSKVTEGSPKRRIPDMKKTFEITGRHKFTTLNSGILKTKNWYEKYIFNKKFNSAI